MENRIAGRTHARNGIKKCVTGGTGKWRVRAPLPHARSALVFLHRPFESGRFKAERCIVRPGAALRRPLSLAPHARRDSMHVNFAPPILDVRSCGELPYRCLQAHDTGNCARFAHRKTIMQSGKTPLTSVPLHCPLHYRWHTPPGAGHRQCRAPQPPACASTARSYRGVVHRSTRIFRTRPVPRSTPVHQPSPGSQAHLISTRRNHRHE
jgi:hypothetical protein